MRILYVYAYIPAYIRVHRKSALYIREPASGLHVKDEKRSRAKCRRVQLLSTSFNDFPKALSIEKDQTNSLQSYSHTCPLIVGTAEMVLGCSSGPDEVCCKISANLNWGMLRGVCPAGRSESCKARRAAIYQAARIPELTSHNSFVNNNSSNFAASAAELLYNHFQHGEHNIMHKFGMSPTSINVELQRGSARLSTIILGMEPSQQ
ncbi:hypothetical protein ABBQ38_006444 [Trebouxia sp. C0009 RCD-2024]